MFVFRRDSMKLLRIFWKLQPSGNDPQLEEALSSHRERINTEKSKHTDTMSNWPEKRCGEGKKCYLIIASGCGAFSSGCSMTQRKMNARSWWPKESSVSLIYFFVPQLFISKIFTFKYYQWYWTSTFLTSCAASNINDTKLALCTSAGQLESHSEYTS